MRIKSRTIYSLFFSDFADWNFTAIFVFMRLSASEVSRKPRKMLTVQEIYKFSSVFIIYRPVTAEARWSRSMSRHGAYDVLRLDFFVCTAYKSLSRRVWWSQFVKRSMIELGRWIRWTIDISCDTCQSDYFFYGIVVIGQRLEWE